MKLHTHWSHLGVKNKRKGFIFVIYLVSPHTVLQHMFLFQIPKKVGFGSIFWKWMDRNSYPVQIDFSVTRQNTRTGKLTCDRCAWCLVLSVCWCWCRLPVGAAVPAECPHQKCGTVAPIYCRLRSADSSVT